MMDGPSYIYNDNIDNNIYIVDWWSDVWKYSDVMSSDKIFEIFANNIVFSTLQVSAPFPSFHISLQV